MSTRTVVFKEIKENEYVGIYVQSDGYLSFTGEVLNRYYADNDDILKLINEKKPLTQIGSTTETVSMFDNTDKYFERNDDGFPCYSKRTFVSGESQYEYFKANSWDEIMGMEYLTYNEKDEVQGIMRGNKFIAFQGSDNNGYIYVQDINNKWFVSYISYKNNELLGEEIIVPLEEALKRNEVD